MDNKIKDGEVLLVKEPESDSLKAVAGIDKGGNIKTVAPTKEHSAEFMKIDRQSNPIENFFSNFMRQAKNPTHFEFFNVPNEKVELTSEFLNREMKNVDDPVSQKFVNNSRINPNDYLKEQTTVQTTDYKPYDVEKVDWKQFEQLGVKRETIEKSGALDQMLNYRKSPELMDISAKVGDTTIRTQARLSLRETEDGRVVPVLHSVRKEPQLDRPFFEHKFTAEDKANLKQNGNLGRTVELVNRNTGEVNKSYVSVDKLTNELVAIRADKVKIPDEIKGVKLDENQKSALAEGKEIYVEGMTAKSGKNFNANIQFNADKRGVEFRFGEQQQRTYQNQDSNGEVRIPNKLGGKELSEKEQQSLNEGATVYISGLRDKAGVEYNAYVKISDDKSKLNFYKWNPDKSKSKEITPDNNSKTQVAVNSEGKTNEATKDLKEPLNKQVEPEERQHEQNKSRGMRM